MNVVYVVEFEFDKVRYLDAVFDSAEKADAYVRERGFNPDPNYSILEHGDCYQAAYILSVDGLFDYDYDAGYAWIGGREVQ